VQDRYTAHGALQVRARRRGAALDGGAGRVCRGQDVGDGVWPVLAAVLPRAVQLQVRRGQALSGGNVRFRRAACGGLRAPKCSGSVWEMYT
jgi:hypothetical protein